MSTLDQLRREEKERRARLRWVFLAIPVVLALVFLVFAMFSAGGASANHPAALAAEQEKTAAKVAEAEAAEAEATEAWQGVLAEAAQVDPYTVTKGREDLLAFLDALFHQSEEEAIALQMFADMSSVEVATALDAVSIPTELRDEDEYTMVVVPVLQTSGAGVSTWLITVRFLPTEKESQVDEAPLVDTSYVMHTTVDRDGSWSGLSLEQGVLVGDADED